MTDIFSQKKRSEVMSKIKGKWTEIEKVFFNENPKAIPHPSLPFHPDFLLEGNVVFIDSPFWHGYLKQSTFDKMDYFWQNKLFNNMLRDVCANTFYEFLGVLDRRMCC